MTIRQQAIAGAHAKLIRAAEAMVKEVVPYDPETPQGRDGWRQSMLIAERRLKTMLMLVEDVRLGLELPGIDVGAAVERLGEQ